uniref:Zinc finger matrin-type 1 n=1 Tax=Sphenodon punctatus TaxID=8508 RepID=A0A8D0GK52_SPHPU
MAGRGALISRPPRAGSESPSGFPVVAGREEGVGASAPPPPGASGRREVLDNTLDEATRKELFTDTFCKVCGAVLQFESQRISHYEGKKHAQKLRLYLQMRGEQIEERGKQKRTDYVNFQDGSRAVDKNKYCSLCSMIFTSPVVAQSHYLGKIHAKKLKQLAGDPAQASALSTRPETGVSVGPSAVSPVLPPPSPGETSQGLDDKDPASSSNVALDLNDPDKYCKLCSAPFNNPLMAHQHYVGKKHKRNEARKKLMEEMGQEAVPAEPSANVGVGTYICPICSITLTSIEMYQSHMQGNKHQIKETMVVNLIKNSKKTYDSFQDELADYIKVQKARGLEPKAHFKKPEKEEFENYESEAVNDYDTHNDDTFPCAIFEEEPRSYASFKEGQHSSRASETCAPSYAAENRLPCRSPAHQSRLRMENVPPCQYGKDYYSKKPTSQLTSYKDDSPSSAESSDGYKRMSSENSTSSYEKGRKLRRKRERPDGCVGEEEPNVELVTQERKRNNEDTDSGKDGEMHKQQKIDMDSGNKKKSKHGKDKRNKEISAEKKESRKQKKDKKKPEVEGQTEEEMLWDESVLGF